MGGKSSSSTSNVTNTYTTATTDSYNTTNYSQVTTSNSGNFSLAVGAPAPSFFGEAREGGLNPLWIAGAAVGVVGLLVMLRKC